MKILIHVLSKNIRELPVYSAKLQCKLAASFKRWRFDLPWGMMVSGGFVVRMIGTQAILDGICTALQVSVAADFAAARVLHHGV